MNRVGQVWHSVYHDETFLVLRSREAFHEVLHEVLTLDSPRRHRMIHDFSEQHPDYWESSNLMDRVL